VKKTKSHYVKKNGDGLLYVNEKHWCFGKKSTEKVKGRVDIFQRWSLKTWLRLASCILTLYYSWLILHS